MVYRLTDMPGEETLRLLNTMLFFCASQLP